MATKAKTRRGPHGRTARNGAERHEAPQPVYFLSLSVENVRCFGPKQVLDLSNGKGGPARWTVILGNNGVGKTTLLQSLAMCQPTLNKGVQGSSKVSWTVKAVDRHQIPFWSWMPLRIVDMEAAFEVEFSTESLLSERTSGDSFIFKFVLDKEVVGWWDELPSKVRGLACHGYGASRRMGMSALSEPKGEVDPDISLFREDISLRNGEEWLLQADYAALTSKDKAAAAKRDRVRDLLMTVLPEVEDIRCVPPADSQAARVELKTPYGWVGMKDLSLGYRTLIAWMVDLASRLYERYPDSPNPLAEPTVVLVDEIDLHLHPKWQRQLMSYLSERFPNTQFIVTAHSPLIVQSAPDVNIAVLRREGDHVVIDNDLDAIRNWRVDQILTSDLFGLESARPSYLDELLAERTRLLSKPRLTAKDKARLRELEARIGDLPTGETKEDREALDIIRRAAEHLREEGK